MEAIKVGKGICFLRQQYGLTQRQLAKHLNISDKAVSKWERGLSVPDVSLLTKLAIFFDTDIESILEGNISSFHQSWKGQLLLNYPLGIGSATILYDKPVVYFQLAYFMLAGISDIEVFGDTEDIKWMQQNIGDGSSWGIAISYLPKVPLHTKHNNTFLVDRLFLVYGKDYTKTVRRILYHGKDSVRMLSCSGKVLGMSFYRSDDLEYYQEISFERGVTAFPIFNMDDLYQAASFIGIIERNMDEQIADLAEISKARGFLAQL